MKITRSKLSEALSAVGADPGLSDRVWEHLEASSVNHRRFDVAHILYYLGALISIGAMGWFIGLQWETLSGVAMVTITSIFMAGYAGFGAYLWRREPATETPGGLFICMSVAMTPLLVYGLHRTFGWWPFEEPGEFRSFYRWVNSGWFVMEVATIVGAAIALRFVRFPFLTAIIAVALWFMSMDLTPILFAGDDWHWEERKLVSLWFGLGMLVVAYGLDMSSRVDFAFWIYLFGLLAFWGSLTAMGSDSEIAKFFYFVLNIALVGLAAYLRRVVFVVVGGLGVFAYLGDLAFRVFDDLVLFPMVLSLIGAAIVLVGVRLQKSKNVYMAWIDESLPPFVARLRPPER